MIINQKINPNITRIQNNNKIIAVRIRIKAMQQLLVTSNKLIIQANKEKNELCILIKVEQRTKASE